ncbi:uncharacterized protein N7529_001169 [Penicillium soppii]|uniref:uncharacterized protein n=1 Tax=Penicillium soppii TaxID=69789 RepID=UPI002546FDDE|nr:uncharacterized protein N7529_001169 [Penicillium soppii]KAJ5882497.1 hypothetical protein N7529_001169 [Penicillium soppii]
MALVNSLYSQAAKGALCKAFGVRLVANPSVVQLAKNSGFDALFIDLEHSTLSINDASLLCMAGLQIGITPFVRVPHQCGNGFVQRVMDGGAMGAAVTISKYPPFGCRSMTGQLPIFELRSTLANTIIDETNAHGSSVLLMIETRDSVDKVEEIAAVDGVDVLLIGSNDLAIELGVPGQFESSEFRNALEKVSQACQKNNKIFGLAGIYDAPKIQSWALNTLGARFILGQQDSGLLATGGKRCAEAISEVLK